MATAHRIYAMPFAGVYAAYLKKAERKGRAKSELDAVICWLTGYKVSALAKQLEKKVDIQTFFADAPAMNPNRTKVTGVVCGVRVEAVEEPLMRTIRQLDKLVDELAKGRPLEKVLRVMSAQDTADRPVVIVQNVNVPGYEHHVDGIRYAAMKAALLKVVPRRLPGMTQTEMRQAVLPHLPDNEFPGGAKADWWSKCVQLDLEAKGVLRRDATAKPLRWYRVR